MLGLSSLPLRPSPLLLLVSACRGDPSFDCEGWARSGECKSNPMFMEQHCAKACATAAPTLDQHGEMEQCAGWSSQGECTRNPKFMLSSCPKNCAAQRAAVHEAALDESPGCIDEANEATCKKSALAQRCAGSCEGWAICSSEADPEECRKALRCRELTDLDADCAARVGSRGCAGLELKRCYLSCARSDLAGVLRRYRDRLTVRTRRYGRIDEDVGPLGFAKGRSGEAAYVAALLPGAAGAGNASLAARRLEAAGGARSGGQQLPCWKATPFDEPPAATCAAPRAALLQRWRRAAEARCRALRSTTPRAGVRRAVRLSEAERERRGAGRRAGRGPARVTEGATGPTLGCGCRTEGWR